MPLLATLRNLGTVAALGVFLVVSPGGASAADKQSIDFNRDIRAILSNNCFQCHGPDAAERQADLRLDTRDGALAVITPGNPETSELIRRVASQDESEQMPPADSGKKLTPQEIELLTQWVREGAPFAPHWSYVKPVRPPLPAVRNAAWVRNAIDQFVLARLEREGMTPSPEADRHTLVRRVTLDLTGLPPTPEEVEAFVADPAPDAYERLVDRLLASPAYGEHWARMWLDLARYADSAGYADDPPRTIWAYRDYVINAFNHNKPFDRFTLEQIAGDLLPNPTTEQLVATAFHRNTLTNNEGGTNDEEFRNVAVVDRVNTTMAVWMGTTMACAQCHSHKYDPISQEEYFRFFAFFNNTEDADRRDERPLLSIMSETQQREQTRLETEIQQLEKQIQETTPQLAAAQQRWEESFRSELVWTPLRPARVTTEAGATVQVQEDSSVFASLARATDSYTLEFSLAPGKYTALQLETLPHESLPGGGPGHANGNFVLSQVRATLTPPDHQSLSGRYVRIEIPGQQKLLSIAEVQVFRGSENVALRGSASQSSVDYDGPARLAIDGNTNGHYYEAKSTTHTALSDNPWWELDLGGDQPIDRIVIWNRTDNGLHTRLTGFRIALLDADRQTVWEQFVNDPPNPSAEYSLSGARPITLAAAYADYAQNGFEPHHVVNNADPTNKGWAVAGQIGKPHQLTLIPAAPFEVTEGTVLTLSLDFRSRFENHTLGRFRIATTTDTRAREYAPIPPAVLAILRTPRAERSAAQAAELTKYYVSIAPELAATRQQLAALKQQLESIKPETTVPIMKELPEGKRRVTRIQYRGNYLDLGPEVTEGVPAVFPPLPEGAPRNRLSLAQWLVSEDNPLTARVLVNRYWEQIFGMGLVRTSEEFGSQGELPSHPELLDWLATEVVRLGWDQKQLVRLLVTSAAYRQSSRVTPELLERDPDNRLLARGPRFRLSAEMVRDQALLAAGLLSRRIHGP